MTVNGAGTAGHAPRVITPSPTRSVPPGDDASSKGRPTADVRFGANRPPGQLPIRAASAACPVATASTTPGTQATSLPRAIAPRGPTAAELPSSGRRVGLNAGTGSTISAPFP